MELGIETKNAIHKCNSRDSDRFVERRLEHLLRLNAEISRQKSLLKNDEQRRKVRLMTRPIDSRHAFGYFGLMIGSLPPLAIVLNFLSSKGYESTGLLLLIAAAGVVAGIIGFQLGQRFVPGALRYISSFRASGRLHLWIILGLAWGALSGAAGGLVIVLIGSIPGAIVGSMVGAIAVPVMVALHSSVRVGDFIETKHFLPIAFGITLSVCAFLLGL